MKGKGNGKWKVEEGRRGEREGYGGETEGWGEEGEGEVRREGEIEGWQEEGKVRRDGEKGRGRVGERRGK